MSTTEHSPRERKYARSNPTLLGSLILANFVSSTHLHSSEGIWATTAIYALCLLVPMAIRFLIIANGKNTPDVRPRNSIQRLPSATCYHR
jgi:hypothetical protein